MCGRNGIEQLQLLFIQMIEDIANQTIILSEHLQGLLSHYVQQPKDMRVLLSMPVKSDVQTHIQNILTTCQLADGAGFASHVSIQDKDYWILEWWFKQDQTKEQQYLELDQGTQQRLDFRTFEWFKETEITKKTYIHGPYVDYLCSQSTAYTLTSAHPVFVNDLFMGVAVVDLSISTLEQQLLPVMNQTKYDIVILNQDNRIVLSNVSRFRTGNIFREKAKLVFETPYSFRVIVV